MSKITSRYEQHNLERLCQGDIFQKFEFINIVENKTAQKTYLPYIVVITQDCDLERIADFKFNPAMLTKANQYLPNILFLAGFPAQQAKDGEHLKELFNIETDPIGGDKWKMLKHNKLERYHFLETHLDLQVPDLVIDFKLYFSIPTQQFLENSKNKYLATISELFRESLNQRFTNYLGRIGLPEIKDK